MSQESDAVVGDGHCTNYGVGPDGLPVRSSGCAGAKLASTLDHECRCFDSLFTCAAGVGSIGGLLNSRDQYYFQQGCLMVAKTVV